MQMIKTKVAFELKNHLFSWILSIVVVILCSFFLNENKGKLTAPQEIETISALQINGDETIGEITDNNVIVQTFTSEEQSFSRIQIPFWTYNRQNEGNIEFELLDHNGSLIIEKKKIKLNEIQDGTFTNIDFKTINNAKGKNFKIVLKAQGLQVGKSVTIWKSSKEKYENGELSINGETLIGDLKFHVLDVDIIPQIYKEMFIILEILALTLFMLVTVLLRIVKDKIDNAFLVIVIPIGITLGIIIPPFNPADEFEHFYRAYEVSAGKFTNQVTEQGLGNYIPESIVNTVNEARYVNQEGLNYNTIQDAFSIKLNPEKETFLRNYASSYPPVIYIPQSLAINIGKLFDASPLMMMYLGRIFNLLVYVSICFVAIKIVPIKKNLFFILAMLPMSIIHAASLSADGITNSTALLFVAYILYLAYGNVEVIIKKHIIIAVAIGIFIALAKIVYIPILLLFLIIPIRKFKNKKIYWRNFILVLAGCILPYIFWNLLNLSNLSVPDLRVNQAVSPKDQVVFVLTHPLQYLKIMIDTMMAQGSIQLMQMLGKAGSNYLYSPPSIVIYTFLFLLFIFGIMVNDAEANIVIRGGDTLVFLVIFFSSSILIYTALYVGFTNVGDPIINGIQGRYFIPILSFFFLSFSNSRIINKDKNIDFLFVTIINSSIFALLLNYIVKINS